MGGHVVNSALYGRFFGSGSVVLMIVIKDVSCCLSSVDYVVLEDNNPLSKALEDKSLPESLFRTLLEDNHGTTPHVMRHEGI